MALNFSSLSDEYKQPYPILFFAKHTKATVISEGDVSEAMDKTLGRNVFRIRGAISAKNFVSLEDLSIAGPVLFFQLLLPEPNICTMHVEISTKNNQMLRISLSTLYNGDMPKFLGRSLRLPFPIKAGWFIMAVDFDSIVRSYCTPAASNEGYTFKCIKKIQVCSNIMLREIVSAQRTYFDGGSILPKELGVKPQTRPFEFTLLDGSFPWASLSQVTVSTTAASAAKPTRSIFNSSPLSPMLASVGSPAQEAKGKLSLTGSDEKQKKFKSKKKSKKTASNTSSINSDIETPLSSPLPPSPPPISISAPEQLEETPQPTIFGSPSPAESALTAAELETSTPTQNNGDSNKESKDATAPTPTSTSAAAASLSHSQNSLSRCDLSLRRVVGYGGGPAVLVYGASLLLCAVGTTIVMIDLQGRSRQTPQTGLWRAFQDRERVLPEAKYEQSFLRGHRNKIGIIEVSMTETYMVSAETEVKNGQIFLWNLSHGSRVASLAPFEGLVVSVAVSASEAQLVTVGTDAKGRFKIIVWSIASLLQAQISLANAHDHFSIVAKQISDFSVHKAIFDPVVDHALVTCGRENIRLWRIKKHHLSGRPILLNEYCRGFIYQDVCIVKEATETLLFASSNRGIVLKISYQTEQVLSAFQLHAEPINTLQVFSGYAVTGSDDQRLRIWPLDFADFLLEARHEGGVSMVSGARNGRVLLVGTKAGTLGLLDVTQHSYETVLRSHMAPVLQVCPRPGHREFATISADRTTRVWSLDSGVQTVEFTSDVDEPSALCYHHTRHVLLCGYKSGVLRLFDVVRACTIAELTGAHSAPIHCVRSFSLRVEDGEADEESVKDVLLSVDGNGEMLLVDCEARSTMANLSTGIASSSSASLFVEIIDDGRHAVLCGAKGEDLTVVSLPAMIVSYSERAMLSSSVSASPSAPMSLSASVSVPLSVSVSAKKKTAPIVPLVPSDETVFAVSCVAVHSSETMTERQSLSLSQTQTQTQTQTETEISTQINGFSTPAHSSHMERDIISDTVDTPTLPQTSTPAQAQVPTNARKVATKEVLLTMVTSKRVLLVSLSLTENQCVLDRSAVVTRKHEVQALRSAAVDPLSAQIALIGGASAKHTLANTTSLSVSAVHQSHSSLSSSAAAFASTTASAFANTAAMVSSSLAERENNEDKGSFALMQIRVDPQQSRRPALSNTLRQRQGVSPSEIALFSFLPHREEEKALVVVTADREGCLSLCRLTSSGVTFSSSFSSSSPSHGSAATPLSGSLSLGTRFTVRAARRDESPRAKAEGERDGEEDSAYRETENETESGKVDERLMGTQTVRTCAVHSPERSLSATMSWTPTPQRTHSALTTAAGAGAGALSAVSVLAEKKMLEGARDNKTVNDSVINHDDELEAQHTSSEPTAASLFPSEESDDSIDGKEETESKEQEMEREGEHGDIANAHVTRSLSSAFAAAMFDSDSPAHPSLPLTEEKDTREGDAKNDEEGEEEREAELSRLVMAVTTAASEEKKEKEKECSNIQPSHTGILQGSYIRVSSSPTKLSRFIACVYKNKIYLTDTQTQGEQIVELHCCPQAHILALHSFNDDRSLLAVFSLHSAHHIALWHKDDHDTGGSDEQFELYSVSDCFFTGESPQRLLVQELVGEQILVCFVSSHNDTDTQLVYHVLSTASAVESYTKASLLESRLTLPPLVGADRVLDLRSVDERGRVVMLTCSRYVCVIALGYLAVQDRILWIDELKPSDALIASYGHTIDGNALQFLAVHVSKSAMLRVHLIDLSKKTSFARTAIVKIPVLESLSSINWKIFDVVIVNKKAKHYLVCMRIGHMVKTFQLTLSQLNQVSLKASMNSVGTKTFKTIPQFLETTQGVTTAKMCIVANGKCFVRDGL